MTTMVGLHIPKCAGSSILKMSLNALPQESIYQNTSIIDNYYNNRPEFLDIFNHKTLKLIWGHSVHEQMLYYVDNPVLFTGVREPVDRLKSHARYEKELRERQGRDEGFDIDEWLEGQKNPICWFIIHRFPRLADRENPKLTPYEKARRVLAAFEIIYVTEKFDESVAKIMNLLGVEVKSEKENKGIDTKTNIKINEELIAFDMELYDWVMKNYNGGSNNDKEMGLLEEFLSGQPDIGALEHFLLNSQAGEYHGWNVLEEVLKERISRANQLMREVEYYRIKLGAPYRIIR